MVLGLYIKEGNILGREPMGIVEFDEGEEVLAPRLNERFGSHDLHEADRYAFFLSNHLIK